jgi:hypothetical protein
MTNPTPIARANRIPLPERLSAEEQHAVRVMIKMEIEQALRSIDARALASAFFVELWGPQGGALADTGVAAMRRALATLTPSPSDTPLTQPAPTLAASDGDEGESASDGSSSSAPTPPSPSSGSLDEARTREIAREEIGRWTTGMGPEAYGFSELRARLVEIELWRESADACLNSDEARLSALESRAVAGGGEDGPVDARPCFLSNDRAGEVSVYGPARGRPLATFPLHKADEAQRLLRVLNARLAAPSAPSYGSLAKTLWDAYRATNDDWKAWGSLTDAEQSAWEEAAQAAIRALAPSVAASGDGEAVELLREVVGFEAAAPYDAFDEGQWNSANAKHLARALTAARSYLASLPAGKSANADEREVLQAARAVLSVFGVRRSPRGWLSHIVQPAGASDALGALMAAVETAGEIPAAAPSRDTLALDELHRAYNHASSPDEQREAIRCALVKAGRIEQAGTVAVPQCRADDSGSSATSDARDLGGAGAAVPASLAPEATCECGHEPGCHDSKGCAIVRLVRRPDGVGVRVRCGCKRTGPESEPLRTRSEVESAASQRKTEATCPDCRCEVRFHANGALGVCQGIRDVPGHPGRATHCGCKRRRADLERESQRAVSAEAGSSIDFGRAFAESQPASTFAGALARSRSSEPAPVSVESGDDVPADDVLDLAVADFFEASAEAHKSLPWNVSPTVVHRVGMRAAARRLVAQRARAAPSAPHLDSRALATTIAGVCARHGWKWKDVHDAIRAAVSCPACAAPSVAGDGEARDAALEEAAKVCDREVLAWIGGAPGHAKEPNIGGVHNGNCARAARAIRALKSKPSPSAPASAASGSEPIGYAYRATTKHHRAGALILRSVEELEGDIDLHPEYWKRLYPVFAAPAPAAATSEGPYQWEGVAGFAGRRVFDSADNSEVGWVADEHEAQRFTSKLNSLRARSLQRDGAKGVDVQKLLRDYYGIGVVMNADVDNMTRALAAQGLRAAARDGAGNDGKEGARDG